MRVYTFASLWMACQNELAGVSSFHIQWHTSMNPFMSSNYRTNALYRGSKSSAFGRIPLFASTQDGPKVFVGAEDLGGLQLLFNEYCDEEGLMTKADVLKVPAIADYLEDDDLSLEELSLIWDKAPKFPDAVESSNIERIDVDSFVQIYRDIDDLFEPDEESSGSIAPDESNKVKETSVSSKAPKTSPAKNETEKNSPHKEDPAMEAELESIYKTICDENGLISKSGVRKWDEIKKLVDDGLLGEDEFDELWSKTSKSPAGGAEEKLDVDGFLSLNVALDDLFDFDDDEMDDVTVPQSAYTEEAQDTTPPSTDRRTNMRMIEAGDLPADVLFVSLANADGLVGWDELKRWSELQEMLADGDLLETELKDVYKTSKKSEMDLNKLDMNGFVDLYNAIDDLFEDGEDSTDLGISQSEPANDLQQVSLKEELLDAISDLESEDLLPCGLEATEREQKEILSIIEMVEQSSQNMIRVKQGAISAQDLNGSWELLYSSSGAMKFNKGLSGIGGSFPNGKFGKLTQNLIVSNYLTDVEYVERIEVKPSSASFDVIVTGTWDLRTSISLFTGEPSIVMTIAPDRVTYGPTSTRADHWKSLGPSNMLDISYLDDDLRIMRGNTSIETIFVYRRNL